MIKDYDLEIEKKYHPENFDVLGEAVECPSCHEIEYRAVVIGNDKDGWDPTGEHECDSCGYQDVEVSNV
jgi:hypothetical protein